MNPVDVISGGGSVVLAMPHGGTFVPDDIASCLNGNGRKLADTDWHIHRLYDGILPDASRVRANFHRYVIDANRNPSQESLYPGQNTTGLCPVTDFDGQPIYRDGQEPDARGIEDRRTAYHAPYHTALAAELKRVRELHGFAILYDCHSIRSHIPFLFEGTLPDFSIGTNSGATCDLSIESAVNEICIGAKGYTSVRNGRFKGGWTTRHYGQPYKGQHAIQMELAQSTYMTERAPWDYNDPLANKLRTQLTTILETLSDWRPR